MEVYVSKICHSFIFFFNFSYVGIKNLDMDRETGSSFTVVKAWASKALGLKTFDLPPTKNSKELLEFYQAVAYLNHVELALTLPHLLSENIFNLLCHAGIHKTLYICRLL
jgi:hypothetical protein